jgi:hypothetical protein
MGTATSVSNWDSEQIAEALKRPEVASILAKILIDHARRARQGRPKTPKPL